jgi:hypothetical protein
MSKICLKEKPGKLWTRSIWLSIVNRVDRCESGNKLLFSEILETFLDKVELLFFLKKELVTLGSDNVCWYVEDFIV